MFQLPVEEDPLDDRIQVSEGYVRLRSYGLPMIFWGYLLAILSVVFFMYLAIKNPIDAILRADDYINHLLAYCVLSIVTLGPIILISFYFYEKEIVKERDQLTIKHKVFFIPIRSHTIVLSHNNPLSSRHLLDSPNMAKRNQESGMSGFENRGYYQAFAKDSKGKEILIDRNSRKGEINKLIKLLS